MSRTTVTRIKLLVVLLISTILILNQVLIPSVILLASVLALIFYNKLQSKFIPWIKPIFITSILVLTLNTFLHQGFGFSLEGLEFGTLAMIRLFCIGSLMFLFTYTSSALEISNALNFLPTNISLGLTLSLSLIPKFGKLYKEIQIAQFSRGHKKSLNLFKTYLPIILPMISRGIDRSEKIAIGMQARGFQIGE